MPAPWSAKGAKASMVGGDQFMILDSQDGNPATKNKRVSASIVRAFTQTPWVADIDANGFDLTDLSNIEFRETTGAPTGAIPSIYADADGITVNVRDTKSLSIDVNASPEYTFSASLADWNSNNLQEMGILSFTNANTSIQQNMDDLQYDVVTSGSHVLRVNNGTEYSFSSSVADWNGNNLQKMGILSFIETDTSIQQFGNSLQYNVKAISGTYQFRIGLDIEYAFSSTVAEWNKNELREMGILSFDANRDISIQQNTNDLQYDVVTSGLHDFRVNDNTEASIQAALLTGFEISDILADSFEIRLQKQQATDPEQVILDDSLGKLTFYGADTNVPAFAEGGRLEFLATEPWGDTDHGTKFEISTTTNLDDTPTLRLTIEQDGTANFETNDVTNVGFINFGSDSADVGTIRLKNADSIQWEASPAGTNANITYLSTEVLQFDIDAGGSYNYKIGTTNEYNFSASQADFNSNNLTNVGFINFGSDSADVGTIRLKNADSIQWEASPAGTNANITYLSTEVLQFDIDAGGSYNYKIGTTNEYNFSASTADFNGNTLTNVILNATLTVGSIYIGDENNVSAAFPTGLETKEDCRLATTSSDNNLDLTTGGNLTIDGSTANDGDRILVKNQDTNPEENGLYIADSGQWLRTADANDDSEVNNGMFTLVTSGVINGNTAWVLTTSNPITVGSTELTFNEFSLVTSGLPVPDTTSIVEGSEDDTKQLRFEIDGFTTGNTRVLTPPDSDGTIDLLEVNQTFTGAKTFGATGNVGKLLIAGTTSGAVTVDATAVASGILTLPNGADTLVGRATTDTFTGAKTFGATGNVGKLLIAGTTSGTTVLDATAVASGTLTLPAATDILVARDTTDTLTSKTIALGSNTISGSTTDFNTALTGDDFAFLGATQTFTGAKTFGATGNVGKLLIAGTTSGAVTVDATAVASGILTLPNGADTLVGRATTDTFTGAKTFGATGNVGKLLIAGTTSGTIILDAVAVAGSNTLSLPASTDTIATISGTLTTPTIGTSLTMSDGANIILDVTNGTQIGTAASQRLGFFGTTAIVQPTHIADPSGGATIDAAARTAIDAILAQLASLGLQASS